MTSNSNLDPRPHGRHRALDVVAGSLLCVAVIPVLAALAVALAAQLRGWPFFVHYRVGQGGRLTRIPKLRTLPHEADPYADKTANPPEPVSRLAEVLRLRHLDELPQLFLVPFGRLSLVGPRPRMPQEACAHGDPDFAARRLQVPQGCTGLWQVGAHQHLRVSDSPEYDLHYVAHRSLRLDLWILWQTGRQMVGGPAVGLADLPAWAAAGPAVLTVAELDAA